MGSGFRTRSTLVVRAGVIALAVTASMPTPAHADLWCWLFNSGCGTSGSTSDAAQQSLPGRSTPEIDAAALAGAVALAAGGAAMLNDRVRRRRR